MAAATVQTPPAPALPDYLSDPDAVLKDKTVKWRLGRAPDYSKTRKYWEETKRSNHEAGSLPQLVENLVKNWEVEASHKTNLDDWRTVDKSKYSFAINGAEPQPAEYMLQNGTYNAIIAPNEYYSPDYSNFASSHKTFKRMMPAFAWEVLEVYSGPPSVSFRWRHWGVMKNDYIGFNNKGEKVTAKAHGQTIDIQGVTVAQVDDQLRVTKLETWFDPLSMFRQIAPQGIVDKQTIDPKTSDSIEKEELEAQKQDVSDESPKPAPEPKVELHGDHADAALVDSKKDAASVSELAEQIRLANLDGSSTHSAAVEKSISIAPDDSEINPGQAVVAEPDSKEARATFQEMHKLTPLECPFMNVE